MKRVLLLYALIFIVILGVVSCVKSNRGAYYSYQNSNAVFDGTAYEFLQSQNGLYDSMLYVINKVVGVKDSLSQNNITLFAVPNTCFTLALNNLNSNRADKKLAPLYLSDLDSAQLDTLICRYIIPRAVVTDSINQFTDGVTYPSIRYQHRMNLLYQRQDASGYEQGGPQQILYSDTKDTIFQRFWISTTTTSVNIHANNGIIDILSGSHEFGFGELSTGADLLLVKEQQ